MSAALFQEGRIAALADITLAGVAVATAVWFVYAAGSLPPPMNPADVGAARFPTLAAVLTILSATGIGVVALRRLRGGHDRDTGIERIRRPGRVAGFAVLLTVFVALLDSVDFYAAAGLFTPAAMVLAGERRPFFLAGITAGFLGGVYVFFDLLLRVPVP